MSTTKTTTLALQKSTYLPTPSVWNANIDSLEAKFAGVNASADGAISVTQGTVVITKGTAAALTLPAPVAGLASAGTPGNDYQRLTIISTTAAAHTVTTPASGINGTLHIATFAAAVGNAVVLVAFNGSWYTEQTKGVTIS
jgi:hypothetical protein